MRSSRIKGDKKDHLQAKKCSREPQSWCSTNQKTRFWDTKEEGLKIASTPCSQETASDGGYEEAMSGFLPETRVDIGRLGESNVQR
ncbi:hypothetical protein E2C01_016221 [Portunus trituberculatus]|uniref:Uncharacterized protein n=1 Tax=Portunus trituberculatus TaxID=210409 RepID=A0A5B7DNI4_PORTR|nr:hypothetical protein [Portunus trituberculatus]